MPLEWRNVCFRSGAMMGLFSDPFFLQGEAGIDGMKGEKGVEGEKGDRGPLGLPVSLQEARRTWEAIHSPVLERSQNKRDR